MLPRRLQHIAALFAMLLVLMACGVGTSLSQVGSNPSSNSSPSATGTPAPPTATPTPDPSRYDGSWVPNSALTFGTGEMVITNTGPTATVHAYGGCGTKCDWGNSSASVGPYTLVVGFTFTSGTAQLTLQLSGSGLSVTDVDSHNGTKTYAMHRATPTELRAFLYVSGWFNTDPHTTGIPQLLIGVVGTTMSVHGWGACLPTYCDWNSRTGTYSGDPFTIVFDFGGGLTHTLTLSLLDSAGNSLQVVDVGSSSGTHTYTFYKSAIF